MNQILYDDGLVQLTSDGITIWRYYFPFATSKYIPYSQIKGVQQWMMGPWTGKWRLWGSGDLQHWFPLDMRRPQKEKLLILDIGAFVKPTFSPNDPDRVLELLQKHISRT